MCMVEGQVQPFWLDSTDGERLFCWHVLPLDVYLANEVELAQAATSGEVVDGLEGTVGAKLLKRDAESRVVVNFHGVSLFLIFSCFLFSASSFCSPIVRMSLLFLLVVLFSSPNIHRYVVSVMHPIHSTCPCSSEMLPLILCLTPNRTQATSPKATAPQRTAPSPASPTRTS
jgi:hypothetical protein